MEGTAGGVELDGESDEIEEHDGAPTDGHDDEVGVGAETSEAGEEAEEWEPGDDLAGEGGGADGGHAPLERGVGDFVLDSVTAFVSGDAEGSGRLALEVLGRENESTMHGVVVISEKSVLFDDFDITNSSGIEDAGGGLGSSKA